jgi:hypothetical protein
MLPGGSGADSGSGSGAGLSRSGSGSSVDIGTSFDVEVSLSYPSVRFQERGSTPKKVNGYGGSAARDRVKSGTGAGRHKLVRTAVAQGDLPMLVVLEEPLFALGAYSSSRYVAA